MTQRKVTQRKAIIAAVVFFAFTAGAMLYSGQRPGVTRAQAAQAHHEVVAGCAASTAAGDGLVALATACMPAPARRADTWLTFGMLVLGVVMLGTGVAASREQ